MNPRNTGAARAANNPNTVPAPASVLAVARLVAELINERNAADDAGVAAQKQGRKTEVRYWNEREEEAGRALRSAQVLLSHMKANSLEDATIQAMHLLDGLDIMRDQVSSGVDEEDVLAARRLSRSILAFLAGHTRLDLASYGEKYFLGDLLTFAGREV